MEIIHSILEEPSKQKQVPKTPQPKKLLKTTTSQNCPVLLNQTPKFLYVHSCATNKWKNPIVHQSNHLSPRIQKQSKNMIPDMLHLHEKAISRKSNNKPGHCRNKISVQSQKARKHRLLERLEKWKMKNVHLPQSPTIFDAQSQVLGNAALPKRLKYSSASAYEISFDRISWPRKHSWSHIFL